MIDLRMIHPIDIINDTIQKTEQLLKALKKCRVERLKRIFIKNKSLFNNNARKQIYDEIGELKGKYIYLFRINNSDKHLGKIKEVYSTFNKGNKPRVPGVTFNIARFNKEHDTSVLYVGSSKKIRNRIKQHLGDGNKRTYSLDLCQWFPKGVDLALEIYSINSDNQQVLETVEQGFWDTYKPLFGKRSGQ